MSISFNVKYSFVLFTKLFRDWFFRVERRKKSTRFQLSKSFHREEYFLRNARRKCICTFRGIWSLHIDEMKKRRLLLRATGFVPWVVDFSIPLNPFIV